MKMTKKLVSIILAVVLFVSLTVPAWAEEMSTTSFNDSTIITEDNMYEVFEYLGLDTSSIREVESDTSLEPVTVGELRERIKVWEESPQYTCVIAYPDANIIQPAANIGIKSVYYISYNDGYNLTFYATGEYYENGSLKYWTKAVPVTVTVEDTGLLFSHSIDIQQMSAAAYQMGSYEESYILMRATYDLYYELQVGGLAGTVLPAKGLITEVYIYAKDWL